MTVDELFQSLQLGGIGDIDKEIAQLCAQSHLLAKLNNNGVLSSAEYAEQAAEIENKIKTLRTERRKKLSENQDDEMLDEEFIECPACGEKLELDIEFDDCDCGCDCCDCDEE